jgi:PAS domain S-box-containing protein
VQDVTARKRSEEELRDIRSRMEAALAAGAIGTWSWDVLNDRVYGDSSLARLFGVPPDAVAGGPIASLVAAIHPDDHERVGALVATAVETGGRYEADYRVADKGHGWRWVTARGQVQRDEGGAVRFPGVVIDVTERKRAEEALARMTAESERRKRLYEAVLDSTPDLAYVWGLDHRFTYANEGLLRMWGKTWDEAIGKNCLELGYEPWHAAMHDREIDQVVATKQPFRGEVPFTGTYGRRIYDYLLVPVLGADGEVEAVAGTTRDVTDRQRMEQELRDQDRKKDDFIALLAHELRNPLAPIRNGLQVIGLSDERAVRERARDMMDRQLTHMVRLIDDLLDVSRITRNKMELRRERVALATVVASAVETAQPMIDAGGHELTVSLPTAPVVLDADLTRLAQVFSNLLTNSAKYTPNGGRVWLSAERAGGSVVVTVRDTGIGIPKESLPTIFDMFSQVDRSVEKSTGGLGIGLALVKGLVEMHGGTVSASSAGDGAGTTFTVTLPEAEKTDIPAPAPADRASSPARRILVVDDNRDGAESMADMLSLLGHEVATAHDGLEAVDRAEAFRPDVILMDVGMPRLNGLDATRRIRERPWGRAMRVVALTGWGQDGDRERSRAAGCDAHLVKPVNVADLQRVLAEVAG